MIREAQKEELVLAKWFDSFAEFPNQELLLSRFHRVYKSSPRVAYLLDANHDAERNTLISLLLSGDAPVDEVVRRPHLLSHLLDKNYLNRPFHENPSALRDLEAFKRFVWLKIVLRDQLDLCDLQETMHDLSVLADRVTISAFEQQNDFPEGLSMWALGKWGANELNASSDIDPVFFRSDTLSPEIGDRAVRSWLHKLMPDDGMEIYRVDLRLRPEGEAGPLVCSYSAAEKYFYHRAAPWERIAYLRARPVYGDVPEWFRKMLDSFLFPASTVPPERLSDVAVSLQNIRLSAGKRDIKRCPGGIRDIEFLVAGFQLALGHYEPVLKSGTVLELLPVLENLDELMEDEVSILIEAYTFFRRVENLLQVQEDRASFTVPASGNPVHSFLAYSMKTDETDFESKLQEYMRQVKELTDKHLIYYTTADTIYGKGWDPQSEEETPSNNESGEKYRFLDSTQGRMIQRRLAGKWGDAFQLMDMEIISSAYDPVQSFKRMEAVIDSYGGPKVWFASFGKRKRMLSDISLLVTKGDRVLSEAVQRPYLFDKIGYRDLPSFSSQYTRHQYEKMSKHLGDTLFSLGSAFITGDFTIREVTGHWTKTIDGCISLKFHEIIQATNNSVSILALGKWGGGELAPEADLDLMFITSETDPQHLASWQSLCSKWMQEIELQFHLSLDARLRPEGSGSPLVITLGRLQEYLETRAEAWEKLGLARVRFICGNSETGEKAVTHIRTFVKELPDVNGWTSIKRARTRAAGGKTRTGVVNIKKSVGGMMDYEFATAFAGWKINNLHESWWSMPLWERMNTLADSTGDDKWQVAVENYTTLRRWELALLFHGKKGASLSRKTGIYDILAKLEDCTSEDLQKKWDEIRNLGRRLFRRRNWLDVRLWGIHYSGYLSDD